MLRLRWSCATLAPASLSMTDLSRSAGKFTRMKKYLIVIERTGTGYSAYSPDLDGCMATGETRAEADQMHS
jgi:hypothetical protein